jgi:phosphohistidine phosphatase
MKTLVIVRHAKSSWDQPALSDHDRPLKKRGYKDAPLIGAVLADWGPPVDRVLSSSAVRALETAEIIVQEMGLSLDEIQIEEDLYHASADEILEIIEEQEDELDGLMLFGHNPGMTDLVNILSDLDLYNLPTAGVVVLQYEVETWKEISQMDPDQVMIDFPKNHR